MLGKLNSEWLKQIFSDIKEGHALVIHLEILQTTYFVIRCSLQCCWLSEIVAIPGHTDLFFGQGSLGQWNRWAVNASVAGLLVSLIQHGLRLQAR